jgi:pyruvate dehydrogenase E2 component (dihydrolipoamide acetyltransferase)
LESLEGASTPSKLAENELTPATPSEAEKKTPAPETEQKEIVRTANVGAMEVIKASPLAKKMAREKGLNLQNIRGSGPEGRIVRKDVEAALKGKQPAGVSHRGQEISPLKASEESELVFAPRAIPADENIPVKGLRSIIAKRMGEAKQTIPHFYVTCDYDVDDLLTLRAQWNDIAGDAGKISVNDFIVKAAALALRDYPNLNASLVGDGITHHGHINIGVAVAVPGGLMTVVCRDTDQKPLTQISAEIREMASRARAGKVHTEDIEGSTFSISNLGMFEVENFAAIINPPEAAILAVGTAREQPVFQDGDFVLCRKMKITISADHRITDGAEAAEFMQLLGRYLAKPLGLLAAI